MRILVVDDNERLGRTLARVLKHLGHETLLTFVPADALALLATQKIDAVISDIDMPEMTGFELARIIRERYANLPIVFSSGSADHSETWANFAQHFLPKPWTLKELQATLGSLTENDSITSASGR